MREVVQFIDHSSLIVGFLSMVIDDAYTSKQHENHKFEIFDQLFTILVELDQEQRCNIPGTIINFVQLHHLLK